MKSLVEAAVWFGVLYFGVAFVRLYYYSYLKGKNKALVMQEIKKHGPFFKSNDRG